MALIRLSDRAQPAPSEITPKSVWASRRQWMRVASMTALAPALPAPARAAVPDGAKLASRPGPYATIEQQSSLADIAGYNNFYEFGLDKSDPARLAGSLNPRPWTVVVDGLVNKPGRFDIDSLLKLAPLEERIYRMRCVEGWSMVIPWVGYPLAELIKRVEPQASARFVEFVTLSDVFQMPGLKSSVLQWPYTEGLRLDEAKHPLTLLTLGLYGQVLPNQNGAPVRVVVPWKYGFKSAKSLVRIRFTDHQPATAWNTAAPREYGFYSNVNPEVDHRRWSQATERRIGDGGLMARKRKTLMFNGYAEQVASLYTGLDLKLNF